MKKTKKIPSPKEFKNFEKYKEWCYKHDICPYSRKKLGKCDIETCPGLKSKYFAFIMKLLKSNCKKEKKDE